MSCFVRELVFKGKKVKRLTPLEGKNEKGKVKNPIVFFNG